MRFIIVLSTIVAAAVAAAVTTSSNASCPTDYTSYASIPHAPYSSGKYKIPSMRPPTSCRTFIAPAVESKIAQMKKAIGDPDLYQLFENTWPNTLDTTVKWIGNASHDSTEELAFVITGDM